MPLPIAIGLGASRALGFLKRVPRWVWIALAAVALLSVATCTHQRKVKAFGKERYAAGVAYEQARIEKKAKQLAAKAEAMSAKLRSLNNETNRRIAGDADALRVRGAGKAACLNPATPGAGRRIAPSGNRNDPGLEVSPGDGQPMLAAVPWSWLVDRAELCDLNRAEVLTWREWHKQLEEAWKKDANR